MNNKKGFTLVELLAVIAILAILVIIALPNVIRLYKDAKKNAFVTEAQTLYKETSKKFISESSKGNKLSTVSSKNDTKLDMTGENLDYCVILDNQGKVTKFAVGNNSYFMVLNDINDVESITKDDVQDGKLTEMKCNSAAFKVKLNCKYDGTLKQGAEFVNGQYTYRYKQESSISGNWNNIYNDGWGVALTNKKSTDPVSSEFCSTINDKPIVSMNSMFYGSTAESMDLSDLDTSNVTNMVNMFAVANVKKITGLENFDTKKVTSMESMFRFSKVPALDLSSFDTSNVTNMSEMFWGASNDSINLSNFDTSKVIYMNDMFRSIKAKVLDLSSFDTSKVTDMSYMFVSSKVEEIRGLNNFNTSNVTNMQGMFSDTILSTIDLSSFNTSNVTKIGMMFENSKFSSIDVSNFNTSKVTSMSRLFSQTVATEIKGLDKLDTSNVIEINGIFSDSSAKIIDVSNFNTSKVTNMLAMFSGAKATEIKGLTNLNTSNVTTMSNMFGRCETPTLDLSSFNTSKVTDMSYMFGESKATNIKGLNKFDTFKVTNMWGMFKNSQVDTIDVSGFDTSNVTTMYEMFSGTKATNLKGLTNLNTSKVTSMGYMFTDTNFLILDLSGFDTSKVTDTYRMFYNCKATTGYAKTQTDANKFNSSAGKPSGLTFAVK